MSSASSATPPRRSQAERSASTRKALLDAAVECLVEDGFAATTTQGVADRAGVSRGAHLHHFGTREALMAAAVERLVRRQGQQLYAEAGELPTGAGRAVAGLDLLWSAFASPMFVASLDVWSHARTDPELRGHLAEVERLLDREVLELARQLFPDAAGRDDFAARVDMAVATIRGLAMLDTLDSRQKRAERQWAYCRTRLAELFEAGPQPR
jgi:AcrR family transcriptional regulator